MGALLTPCLDLKKPALRRACCGKEVLPCKKKNLKAFPLRGRCHGFAVTDEVESLREPLFSGLNKVFRSANAPLVQRGDAP